MQKGKLFLAGVVLLAIATIWAVGTVPTSAQQQSLLDQWKQKHAWVYQFEDEMSGGSYMFMEGPLSEGQEVGEPNQEVPVVGANVRVSDPQNPAVNLLARSETTGSVTNEGKNIVAGWNDADGFLFFPFSNVQPPLGLSGFGFSVNGGMSFTDGGAPPVGPASPFQMITRGDPWMDTDNPEEGGTIFYANLAVFFPDPAGPPGNQDLGTGIMINRGRFQSGTFTFDNPIAATVATGGDFHDKEALVADKRQDSTAVYISYTNFTANNGSQIELVRSFDKGLAWSAPTVVKAGEGPTGVGNTGTAPAVGPNGEVFVAWERGRLNPTLLAFPEIRIRRSNDQGATFGPEVVVSQICRVALKPPAGYNRTRYNEFPRIDVVQKGKHKGRVLVSYQSGCTTPGVDSNRAPSADVFVRFSDDGGLTWSAANKIAPVGPPVAPVTDIIQFWPVVTSDPEDPELVSVVFNQSSETDLVPNDGVGGVPRECRPAGRSNPGQTVSSLVDVFWSLSTDGGTTFGAPVRVTDVTSNWCKGRTSIIPNFGDYIGNSSFDGSVFPTWPDSRNPAPADVLGRNRFIDVFAARGRVQP